MMASAIGRPPMVVHCGISILSDHFPVLLEATKCPTSPLTNHNVANNHGDITGVSNNNRSFVDLLKPNGVNVGVLKGSLVSIMAFLVLLG